MGQYGQLGPGRCAGELERQAEACTLAHLGS